MTMRVASQPRKEKIPREHATEHRTMMTPASPTTDLACIILDEQDSCSFPSVSDTYLSSDVRNVVKICRVIM